MEVCGTHTMSILKSGLKELLPQNIKLISGPGCPVCVTPQEYIDMAIELCKKENVIITTFGDLVRVPGTYSSLQKEKALGRDIRVVFSPLDSLEIAKSNLDKEVVFLGVGFEKVLLLQNPLVYSTGDVVSTYLYRVGILSSNFSYATAIGIFEAIIGLVLVLGSNRISAKITKTSLW